MSDKSSRRLWLNENEPTTFELHWQQRFKKTKHSNLNKEAELKVK